jgi:hypothetical protein
MDFYNYISWLPRIFLHPIKGYSYLVERLRSGENHNIIMFSIVVSIIGNTSLVLSNMLVNNNGRSKTGFILMDIIFSILAAGFIYFFTLAIIYFILSILGRKIELKELGVLFFSADFLFVLLLPVSIILLFLPDVLPVVSGILLFIIFIMNIVLKIRAIILSSSISTFGSIALFFTPLLFCFIALLTGLLYVALSIFKVLSY